MGRPAIKSAGLRVTLPQIAQRGLLGFSLLIGHRHIHENVMYTAEMPPERLDRACEMMMEGWGHTRCPEFCDLLGIDGTALVEEFQAVMKRIHSPAG